MKFPHHKDLCAASTLFKQFKILKGEKGYSLMKKSESIFCLFLFLLNTP